MVALGRAARCVWLLALSACASPPPRWATHTCGSDRPYIVRMPLQCHESVEAVLGAEDRAAGIERALVTLVARATGRSHEVLVGLAHEFGRVAAHQREGCAAACQAWTAPCDGAQHAAYESALDELRGRNDRLRDVYAAVADLARRSERIDGTDEATRRTVTELEVASEALDRAPAAPRVDLR